MTWPLARSRAWSTSWRRSPKPGSPRGTGLCPARRVRLKTLVATWCVVACVLASGVPQVASAQSSPGGAAWVAGPSASGDNTYAGAIDAPGNGATLSIDRLATLSGWFVDKTAQGWSGADDVQVFAGTMDSGTSLGHGTLGLPRSDVASALGSPYWAAAGWSASIDPGALPLGPNTLSVYVHTPSKGWWYTQLSVTVAVSGGGVSGPTLTIGGPIVAVSAPLDGEVISTHLGNYRITGTARDPVAGARAIDRVQLWLNG